MKYQILFSRKNKKNISKCHLLTFLHRMQSINLLTDKMDEPNFNDRRVNIRKPGVNKLKCIHSQSPAQSVHLYV